MHLLQKAGAVVSAWEPYNPNAQLEGIDMSPSFEEAIKNADAILILVKHSDFANIDPNQLLETTSARTIIDTVNIWDHTPWDTAGFKIVRLGVNKT